MSVASGRRDACLGVWRLILSDYEAFYAHKAESRRRSRLLMPLRLLGSPSMHAVVMLRLASAGPPVLFPLWRTLLIAKHSIEFNRDIEIGPGLMLPHPMCIALGSKTTLGRNVVLHHNCSIGGRGRHEEHLDPSDPRRGCPVVGDRVIVYPGAVVVGGIAIGDDCVVGANALVVRDMEPGEMVSGPYAETRRR